MLKAVPLHKLKEDSMKFSFDRKEFIDALLVGGSMAGKTKVLPILDCVKLNIRGEKSTISSYNGDVAITKRVPVNSEEECSLCVNKQDLDRFIRSLTDDVVDVEYSDNTIVIKHKKGKLSLPTFNVDDFVQPNIEKDGDSIVVGSASLLPVINEASKFCGIKDDFRPILSCINMVTNGKLLEISATDTMSLYSSSIELSEEHPNFVINLTDTSIAPLKNMLGQCSHVTIINGERSFTVKSDDALLSALKLEGRFPNVKAVIPNMDNCTRIGVNVKEFTDAVKRCSMNADKSTSIIAIESKNPSFVEVSSNDSDFNKSTVEYVACELDGSFNGFAIKYAYLLSILSCVRSENITIAVMAENRPIIIEDELAKNNTYLMMPFLRR